MKFVSMKKVHGGKFLSRYDIVYETIDGGRKNYEMVSRSGDRTEFHQLHDHDPEAVIMIMHDPSGEKILINREFRLAMGEFIYNFPAGLVDEGEDWDTSAARELREETGAVAGSFQSVGELSPSPGYCGEIIRMYLARDLSFGDTDPDEDEFLGLERVPFSQLVEQVLSGEIRDAKTIAAVLKVKLLLGL